MEKEAGLQFLTKGGVRCDDGTFFFLPHHLDFSFFLNEVVIGPGLHTDARNG